MGETHWTVLINKQRTGLWYIPKHLQKPYTLHEALMNEEYYRVSYQTKVKVIKYVEDRNLGYHELSYWKDLLLV